MPSCRLSAASSYVSPSLQSQALPRFLYSQVSRVLVAFFLLLCLENWWHTGFEELENEHELEFYPLELLQDVQEIADSERLHLAMLHEGCVEHRDSVITSDFGRHGDKTSSIGRFQQDDDHLRTKLAQCPDVEVFLPSIIRGDGYCEDAMGYVKCESSPRFSMDCVNGSDILQVLVVLGRFTRTSTA